MRHASLPLLLLLALVAGAADVRAQAAPQVGSCTLGQAEAFLDVNNVFGVVFNTGSLFYGNAFTNGNGYLVPKSTRKSPVYASGIWVGGRVGGQLRVAGSRYDRFNFWPGPLDANTGRPVNPASCEAYDRIYSVTRNDIRAYEAGGRFSADLTDWPAQLGAPVVDGDGNPSNYNLAGGDRPDIIGDQGIWWVMNDVGGVHSSTNTPPLGIEVQVLAFAFARADALGSTTFYRYKIINKSGAAIEQTYVSVFSDPDLGYASDDFVGSDTAAGLGYVYNADNADDGSSAGYGNNPPAVGYDFFQGPIVADNTNQPADANTDPDTLGTSAFSYFINGSGPATTDPSLGTAIYNYQQGLWADGTQMRAYGNGYAQTQGEVTKFAFPGDPVTGQAWSEINNGTATPRNAPGDRRLVIHTGPFTLPDDASQDIVFGIIYARGTSNTNSITALRASDRLAQRAYDIDFVLPAPPPAPALCTDETAGSGTCLSATSTNGQATLTFGYPSSSANFLGQYEVTDGFIVGQGFPDVTYNFEGFNIYRYPNANFATEDRELIATYDIVNGVTEVRDQVFDPELGDNNTAITARGTDSGLQYSYTIDGLTNFTDYYYGVAAYAFNEFSSPKVIESQVTNLTVRPSGLTSGVTAQGSLDSLVTTTEVVSRGGAGVITARIVDPAIITGDTYRVTFFDNADGTTNYNIVNSTTGAVVLSGVDFYSRTGQSLPQGEDVIVADGLSFSVTGPDGLGFEDFQITSNAAGPLAQPVDGAADPNGFGFPIQTREDATPQVNQSTNGSQSTSAAQWGIHTACNSQVAGQTQLLCEYFGEGFNFVGRTLRNGANLRALSVNDYELRFRTGTNYAYVQYSTPNQLITVPFQLWDLGADATSAADDVRMIPLLNEWAANGLARTGVFDIGADHPTSGALNDPQTDWIFWNRPTDQTPGQAGYDAFVAAAQAQGAGYATTQTGILEEVMANMTIVNFNGGVAFTGPFNSTMPEAGTTFRIVTSNPNLAGETFDINTASVALTETTPEGEEAALDRIAAVPNPYYGQSSYETGNLSNIIRFTNLPPQATTLRIYTVSGSLVQTLRKEGASRSLDWDLTTVNNLPIASGMYLVHVDVEGVGERTLKLGVINRRPQVNVF